MNFLFSSVFLKNRQDDIGTAFNSTSSQCLTCVWYVYTHTHTHEKHSKMCANECQETFDTYCTVCIQCNTAMYWAVLHRDVYTVHTVLHRVYDWPTSPSFWYYRRCTVGYHYRYCSTCMLSNGLCWSMHAVHWKVLWLVQTSMCHWETAVNLTDWSRLMQPSVLRQ